MGEYVATQIIKLMVNKGLQVKGSKALILGVTFKENCSDIRNSKVVDIYTELKMKPLSREFLQSDDWQDWTEVLALSNLNIDWVSSGLFNKWFDSSGLGLSYYEFYIQEIWPLAVLQNTKLGRYLNGYEDKESHHTSGS